MKSIKQRTLYREVPVNVASRGEQADQSIRIAISSELPVLTDVGTPDAPYLAWEILDHSPSSVDLQRFTNRPPFLVNHDTDRLAGSLTNIAVEKDRVLRGDVLFSRSQLGQEIQADVEDGHRPDISVGYRVMAYREEGEKDGYPVLRAIKWMPVEASTVPIPADISVGIGRKLDEPSTYEVTIETAESQSMRKDAPVRDADDDEEDRKDDATEGTTETVMDVEDATENADDTNTTVETPAEAAEDAAEGTEEDRDDDEEADDDSDTDTKAVKPDAPKMNKSAAIHLSTRNNEVAAIVQLASDYNIPLSRTANFIQQGLSYDAVHSEISNMANEANSNPVATITLSEKEKRQFDLVGAMRVLAEGGQRSGLVFEVSDELAKTRNMSGERSFFIPTSAALFPRIRADLTTTTNGGASAIFTEPGSDSIIEFLRNRAKILQLGAQVLSFDNVGSIRFPRQSATGDAFWRGEAVQQSASTLQLDSVTATQKTLTGVSKFSREFLHNSSYGANDMVVRDLTTAMAVKLDAAAISGSGALQPTGLLNLSGVGSYTGSASGSALSFQTVVGLKKLITAASADVDNMKWLTNANVEAAARSTTKIPGGQYSDFIWEAGNKILGYDAAVSANVPSNIVKGSGTGLSALILGDFAQMLFVEWGGVEVIFDPYTSADTGMYKFSTHLSCDVVVRHPQSFAVCMDIIA